ncbi:tetratricopeptide repeat protein [Longibacter sp.]|uniref:tetratricopeptide repeat protein n=1 Tax=Longibacter sp. TaxID=2045415 RepID=UPI003EBEDD2E
MLRSTSHISAASSLRPLRSRMRVHVAILAVVLAMVLSLGTVGDATAQAPGVQRTLDEDSQTTHARKLFVRGMTRAFLEDYEAAIAYYEQALGLTPNEAPVLSALAEAKAETDDVTSALYYAERARDRAADNAAYHTQLADLQREAGRYAEAIQTYNRMLRRFPANVDARMDLAQTQIEAQEADAAIDTYEAVLNQGTDTPRVHLELLQLYRQTENADGIESSLRALMRHRPADQLYPHLLGQFYMEEGRTGEAIELYEKLLRRRPGSVNVVMRLTSLYREAGRTGEADSLLHGFVNDADASPDQFVARARSLTDGSRFRDDRDDPELRATAERLLNRALEMDPNHADALALLGDLKYEAGEFERSAELLQRALQQNPRSPQRWTRAAAAHLQAGQARRASTVADEGLLLFPGRASLLRVSAYASMNLGQNGAAATRFREAIDALDADQNTLRSQLNGALGLVYARMQQFSKSDAAYARALDANPEHAEAANNYAFSLADRGVHLDRALRLARRAVRLDSTNAAYLDTLGWVYFKKGNFERARSTLHDALRTGQATASVYEHFGDVSEALGDTETAREYWRQALQRAPERDRVQDKLNALQDD